MISRIYIDNFRCLVNFELKLDALNLLLGPNGSGKSTTFDVLRRVQRLIVEQESVETVFKAEELSRNEFRGTQRFEIDILLDDGTYCYALVLEHHDDKRKRRIVEESLRWNGQPLCDFRKGMARLYRDDHSEGPEFPFDWTRSAVAMLQPRSDNKKLMQFRDEIGRWVVAKLIPPAMDATSLRDASRLDMSGGNFASWYRFLSQEHQGNILELTQCLRNVLSGFDSFSLREYGEEARVLSVAMRMGQTTGKPMRFSFDELSDGQRMLAALYTLLIGVKGEGYSLFLDEPDNFISLREVQPWLFSLQDACGGDIRQALLISHHPETLNLFAPSCGRWFERPENGPTRVKDTPPEGMDDCLTAAEMVARGWET